MGYRTAARPIPSFRAHTVTELWKYRDLVWALVARDLKVRYRRSAIGFLWTMLQPLLTMVVMALVFSSLFRFAITNYPVYALSGILFFNFFSQSVTASMNSLRHNAALILTVPVPNTVYTVATVLSGMVNLAFALVPLLILVAATGHPIRSTLLFLPVSFLIVGLFAMGAGLLLAPLAVFFADVVEMVGVALTMLLYLTPVFYPISIVPERWRWIVLANPLRSVLEVFRAPIYDGEIPALPHLLTAVGLAVVTIWAGARMFRRASRSVPLHV